MTSAHDKKHTDSCGWPASLAELETMDLIKKLTKVREGLKEISYYNAVVYNGRSDEAGDMRRMARRLLAELEK